VLVAENGAISVDPCPTQNKINRNVTSVQEPNATRAAILNKILDGGISQRYVLTVAVAVPSYFIQKPSLWEVNILPSLVCRTFVREYARSSEGSPYR
jgi:hypothetical protein